MAPAACQAACALDSALGVAIATGFEPSSDNVVACKALPDRPNHTVVAYTSNKGNYRYPITVLIVNETGKVQAEFSDSADPYLNGIGDPNDIEIDTVRYDITLGKRAFGVRVAYSLNSWDRTRDLFLFLGEGSQLKLILKGATVASYSSHVCYSSEI